MVDRNERTGIHPLDEVLSDQWLLRWILPSLQILKRNLIAIAPVALAYGVYVWLLPKVWLTSTGQWGQLFDSVQMTLVVATFMAVGYVRLARSEGARYGLAQIAPISGVVQRLLLIAIFWLVFSAVLGGVLRVIGSGLIKSQAFIGLGMWLFSKLNWWSIPFVLWLFSPLALWLATVSALTQIRAIRAEEPLVDNISDSFSRVFAEPLRIAVPAYILVAAAILLVYVFAELIFNGLAGLFMRAGWGAVIALAGLGMALVLPFWFVIERVYAPELGVEDDVQIGMEDAGEALPALPVASLSEQLAQLLRTEGSEAAARRVANWIRARQGKPSEWPALMQQVGDPQQMARQLSVLLLEWSESSKPGELTWLFEQGSALNPAFMLDLPDRVLSLAKKLTQAERSDLATRLLLGFLKQHRQHPDHLLAGLQLARVLVTHANNREGARKLLGQLAQMYPSDPQPAQLLKQLA